MERLYVILAGLHLVAVVVTGILWTAIDLVGLACLVLALLWTAGVSLFYALLRYAGVGDSAAH